MQLDDIAGLGIETNDIHPARQGLEIDPGPDRLPEFVHHVEGILVRIKYGGLEHGAAARLKVIDPRLNGRLYSRHEIITEDARSVNGLEAVPESRDHHIYSFLCHKQASQFVPNPQD